MTAVETTGVGAAVAPEVSVTGVLETAPTPEAPAVEATPFGAATRTPAWQVYLAAS